MSFATDAGLIVGNKYVIIKDDQEFEKGTVVTFIEDDFSSIVKFNTPDGVGGYAYVNAVALVNDATEEDFAVLANKQNNYYEVATYEQGTAFTFQKQLTASQIGRILAIAEEA